MITQISKRSFIEEFQSIRPDNFSSEGLDALYDYFEDLQRDLGESIEFDPIGICCEYSEHKSPLEAARLYVRDNESFDAWGAMIEEHANQSALYWLMDHTFVIEVEGGGVIIQDW